MWLMWSPRQVSPSPITPLWGSTNDHTFPAKRPHFTKRKTYYSSHRKLQKQIWESPVCGRELWLVSNPQNTSKERRFSLMIILLYVKLHPANQLTLTLLLVLKKNCMLWIAYGKGQLARNGWSPLGPLSGLQPIANKKLRPPAPITHKEMTSANNVIKLGSIFFYRQASR